MSLMIFLALLAFYWLVAIKVEEWTVISLIGSKLEVPLNFLKHPTLYLLTRWAMFFVVAVSAFNLELPWYIGLGALLLAKFSAEIIANSRAFETFRRMHRFLAAQESDPNELADLEAGARITNSELKARLALARKYAA